MATFVISTPSARTVGSFRQMYDEAIGEFRMFHGYASDVLQSCNDDDFSAAKENFRLAESHYKKVDDLVAHLRLWHTARMSGKSLADWTKEERKQEILISSLAGMVSAVKYRLMNAYSPWLQEASLVTSK